MQKARFTEEQIAFVLKQVELGRRPHSGLTYMISSEFASAAMIEVI